MKTDQYDWTWNNRCFLLLGARCKLDRDCGESMCCARHHGEQVCKRRLIRGESCYVPDGGLAFSINQICPCDEGLLCREHSGSLQREWVQNLKLFSQHNTSRRRIENRSQIFPENELNLWRFFWIIMCLNWQSVLKTIIIKKKLELCSLCSLLSHDTLHKRNGAAAHSWEKPN